MKLTRKLLAVLLLVSVILGSMVMPGTVLADVNSTGGSEQGSVSGYTASCITFSPGRNETELNFAWYSNASSSQSVVQVVYKTDITGEDFPADEAAEYTGTVTPAVTGFYSNKVTVSNLKESTEYAYRVGDGSEENWSPVYNFTTHDTDSFSFLAVGDPQIGAGGSVASDSNGWGDTLSKAVAQFPDVSFILSLGDQVNSNNDENQYNGFFAPQELRSLPLAPAMGNHDNGASNYDYHYNIPNLSSQYGITNPGTGDYYFTYGKTLFMVLNTNNSSGAAHEAFIQETVNVNPNVTWKVVMFHQDIYGSASHSTSSGIVQLRQDLFPIFDTYGIDLVLTGHDHSYTRTYPMIGDQVQSVPQGTVYFTLNSASGSKYYDLQAAPETYAAVRSQLKVPTFTRITESDTGLTISTYRTDTMAVTDSYTILKQNGLVDIASATLTSNGNTLNTDLPSSNIKLNLSAKDSHDADVDLSVVYAVYKSSPSGILSIGMDGTVTVLDKPTFDETVQVWAELYNGGSFISSNIVSVNVENPDGLAEVTLSSDSDSISADSSGSIKLSLSGKDNLKSDKDLSSATVEYKTDNDGTLNIASDGTVTIQNKPSRNTAVKITAEVTDNTIKVASNTITINVVVSPNNDVIEIQSPIKNSMDDTEERVDGSLDYDSSDLEITWESPTSSDVKNQLIGLRFSDIDIPKGAKITDAYIQFSVDEPNKSYDPFNVNIYAESTTNSAAIENVEYSISSRTKTTEYVNWKDAPMWTVEHEEGLAEQTPDISSLVQKIVDMDGWNQGNSMCFILSGEGNRTAESFEGAGSNTDQIPTLHVSYTMQTSYDIISPVKAATDDMEEWISSGDMDYDSSDLEIGLEKPDADDEKAQYVGIRFADLAIPKEAKIQSAYIQFTVDELKNKNPFNVNIYAEDIDDSNTFADVPHNISSRTLTTGSVNWSLDTTDSLWVTVDEAGAKEQTPDISSLIQHIVDRAGWNSGNSISFIMSGPGTRTAVSYDNSPEKAPVLYLTYTLPSSVNQDQEAPTGLTGAAPTSSSGNDGKITGTTTAMEYKLSSETTWTAVTGTEITGLAPGTYNVRYAAREGYNAGQAVDIVVGEYQESKLDQAAPAGLAGIPLTKAIANDGKISGTTTAMEYKKSYENDTGWKSAAATEITGLAAGIYNVRYAAKEGYNPSPAVDVIVSAVTKVALTFIEDSNASKDTTNSKGFAWYTVGQSDSRSDVQIIKKTSESADFSSSSVIAFAGTCTTSNNSVSTNESKAQEYLHKAQATGLEANTTYFFRVGDSSLNLWSETGTFATAAENGAFTFLDLADPQAKELDEAILAANTFKTAFKTVPDTDFIAVNGDIVDDGSKEYEWDWLFNNMSDVMLNTTIAPIAGNHEKQTNSFINHFNLIPASGSAATIGAYYSFDYSNAHFVMLNTNESSTTYSDFSVEQVNWMKEDIADAKQEGKWIIALIHKGPYTTSNHATDGDIAGTTGVRNLIAPIFADMGVDLVLQGHDHIYARSKPIKEDNTAAEETIISDIYKGNKINYQVNPDGTIYLIPSTAGPKVYYKNQGVPEGYYDLFDVADESHSAIYGADPADATRPERSMVDNFESITIDENKLTVISYEIDHGGLISPTEDPYVIDTFGIVKGEVQSAPAGLTGVAPSSVANADGKITGTTADMEYKLSADTTWTASTGDEITGLIPGIYQVRYAANSQQSISMPTDVTVPEYTEFALNIGEELAGGAGFTRTVNIDSIEELTGKFMVVQFTEGTGANAKVSVVMVSETSPSMTVSYQKSGTKVDVWLVSGMPDLVGEDMKVQIYANSSTN